VLACAELDDLSPIVIGLITVDKELLPATLTAHVKKSHPELLKQYAGADGEGRKASKRPYSATLASDTDAHPSGRGIHFEEVHRLCLEREEHRKASNFNEADRVRSRLQSMGVSLDDKRHIFIMPDGEQGSYDLHHQGGGAIMLASEQSWYASSNSSPDRDVSASSRAPAATGYRGFANVLELAMDREHARRDSDFQRADSIRDELANQGVQLDDKAHLFTMRNGLQGTYSLQRGMGIHEVRLCCLDREEARRDNDFASADGIRDQLVAIGVKMDDKTHTFVMPDGHRGSYDLHIAPAPGGSALAIASSQAVQPYQGDVFAEVERRCYDREYARRDGDYTVADRIRKDLLEQYGVHLEDRTHSFTMPDGRRGNYDLHRRGGNQGHSQVPANSQYAHHAQVHAQQYAHYAHQQYAMGNYAQAHYAQAQYAHAQHASAYYAQAYPAGGSHAGWSSPQGNARFRGYFDALRVAHQREEVRKHRNYREADRLRTQLKQMGVECDDATHSFQYGSLRGSYDLHQGVGSTEVQYVTLEREEARRDRDYAKSDQIRDWLLSQGVQVEDKSHTFTMADGTTGSYDLHQWEESDADGRSAKRTRR